MTGWRRNRVRVPALVGAVIALLCGLYVTAGWLRTKALQALMMTTADPYVLGRVLSDSMETVTLTLESDHVSTIAGPGPLAPADHRIAFRLPRAYVNAIDLKEGRRGSQVIGFAMYHRSFDPVGPDQIADTRKCRVGVPCYAEPADRGAQRRRDGDLRLEMSITNGIGTRVHRDYVLGDLDGAVLKRPCNIFEDVGLGMLVAETPQGVKPREACNFSSDPGIRTRDGKSFPPKNFLKRKADGSPEFVVRCHSFADDAEERAEIKCRMIGYFGMWPMLVWIWEIPPEEWVALHGRIQQFLTTHLAHRTDTSEAQEQ